MRIVNWRKRSVFVAACVAMLFTASGSLTSASAANVYWTFKNHGNGKCLTASSQGTVWVAACTGGRTQQWDFWGGSEYAILQNRETGQCLRTDAKSDRNAVWTTACDVNHAGQYWSLQSGRIRAWAHEGGQLRTSPSDSNAVYNQRPSDSDVPAAYYTWTGTHT
ncbi:ricin-type beta-trefoil lectin domain protein [Streptomyces sp. 8K308]|uniref:RICIN domain-containing protein n=1 Tax=Streptomyces sp. 8K308 TaxID=2530388 RepID=UPI0014051AC8|nr:ricin-type beta-trefoil lectin domain protein [Streptomyces sp. 8K308]